MGKHTNIALNRYAQLETTMHNLLLDALLDVSGVEIIAMLEGNPENTFASDPYKQMGGYLKRRLGMKMSIKLGNPSDMRVQDLFIGNVSLTRVSK